MVIVGDVSAVYFGDWTQTGILEVALLFDFAVLLPVLYWWCYRKKGKAAVVQAIALACFAIWATGMVLPEEHREIVDSVGWLRYIGLAGLLVLELKLLVSVYKAVVVSGKSPTDAQAKLESEGMPSWASKLVAMEAAFWRKMWLQLKRLFDRS
ncbi:MAG: hypothetical protein C0423_04270 [Methylibium sp.]|nr:hypothetical protein [Methylibium sp.]